MLSDQCCLGAWQFPVNSRLVQRRLGFWVTVNVCWVTVWEGEMQGKSEQLPGNSSQMPVSQPRCPVAEQASSRGGVEMPGNSAETPG